MSAKVSVTVISAAMFQVETDEAYVSALRERIEKDMAEHEIDGLVDVRQIVAPIVPGAEG